VDTHREKKLRALQEARQAPPRPAPQLIAVDVPRLIICSMGVLLLNMQAPALRSKACGPWWLARRSFGCWQTCQDEDSELKSRCMCCVYAAGERSVGVYKTYYWLTICLFLLLFIMAAWFVCLVAVNTTGAPNPPLQLAITCLAC